LGSTELRSRYPLELVAAKNDDSMNSTFGNRPEVDQQTGRLDIHPVDACSRLIAKGTEVRVVNDRGECLLIAHLTTDVAKGVVRAPSVRWNKRAPFAAGINRLTSDRLTDIGGGPTFYSCLVDVVPAVPAPPNSLGSQD
jgi:anaerobic selenocysteine-containing dehydrogenase